MSERIIESISDIFKRISDAALRSGRDPSDIKLIAVTKTIHPSIIRYAIDAGIRSVGENRVQEARDKIDILKGDIPDDVSWHMIGHLQSNKAKLAVSLFDMIQSVDSIGLARKISRHAAEKGKVQRVLIQVKLAEEESKSGISPAGLRPLLVECMELENIAVEGLMTITPFMNSPEDARPYYRKLREIREELEMEGFKLPELSMGMSRDFEIGIEEGATMVRIGTLIFGRRQR
jgi:pyridoxal phosphate enzyme (YggS family)